MSCSSRVSVLAPTEQIRFVISRKRRDVTGRLLEWGRTHQREFRWRQRGLPRYTILVAEVLLRQTGARAVETFLPRFLDRCPGMDALAAVTERDLKGILEPLGLAGQRARQLKAVAEAVVGEHRGVLPGSAAHLSALPGIGRYTAAMIVTLTSDAQVPAVDTPVARLLGRVFRMGRRRGELRKDPRIWRVAEDLVRVAVGEARQLNLALIDLSAEHCTSAAPQCGGCPLAGCCAYHRRRVQRGP